ncbi:MAG TPA: AraC family transcriptional regulator [Clostridia bacterium]|nr:AraC family transcriptional regulator [Clostridia bacterium]
MEFIKAELHDMVTCATSGKLISSNRFVHPSRIVDSYLILFGIRNTLYIQEDNEKYYLDRNTSLLLIPNERQSPFKPSYDISYLWCHFYFTNIVMNVKYDEAIQIYDMMNNDVFSEKENIILIPKTFQLPHPEKFSILFHQLLDYSNGDYYTCKMADYCLSSLLIELTQQAIKHFTSDFSKTTYQFSKMVEWIKANVNRPLTVSEIADTFNYNANYLSNLFRDKTGYSLVKFINKSKISKAKELLLETDKTIKEIAFDLGFSDDKYFLKVFKMYMDMTPSEYRNSYCNMHINNK